MLDHSKRASSAGLPKARSTDVIEHLCEPLRTQLDLGVYDEKDYTRKFRRPSLKQKHRSALESVNHKTYLKTQYNAGFSILSKSVDIGINNFLHRFVSPLGHRSQETSPDSEKNQSASEAETEYTEDSGLMDSAEAQALLSRRRASTNGYFVEREQTGISLFDLQKGTHNRHASTMQLAVPQNHSVPIRRFLSHQELSSQNEERRPSILERRGLQKQLVVQTSFEEYYAALAHQRRLQQQLMESMDNELEIIDNGEILDDADDTDDQVVIMDECHYGKLVCPSENVGVATAMSISAAQTVALSLAKKATVTYVDAQTAAAV
eukprot:Colp12_sorted_trinity150504_noHs@14991